jgi:hypothetical protein
MVVLLTFPPQTARCTETPVMFISLAIPFTEQTSMSYFLPIQETEAIFYSLLFFIRTKIFCW